MYLLNVYSYVYTHITIITDNNIVWFLLQMAENKEKRKKKKRCVLPLPK